MPHGAGPNNSDRPRCAQFMKMFQINDLNRQAVQVRLFLFFHSFLIFFLDKPWKEEGDYEAHEGNWVCAFIDSNRDGVVWIE